MSDPDATFANSIGYGKGTKVKRFAMIIEKGHIQYAAVNDTPGQVLGTDAHAVIQALDGGV